MAEEVKPDFDAEMTTRTNQDGSQVTNINVQVPQTVKNSVGTAGFVLALIGLFLCWVPVLGWILWILGAILSIVGLFRKPKGLAIAGTVISFIDIIVLIILVGGILGTAGMLALV